MEYMFVAILCIGQQCDFVISKEPVTLEKCESLKTDFLALPFKPEITFAATQCVKVQDERLKL